MKRSIIIPLAAVLLFLCPAARAEQIVALVSDSDTYVAAEALKKLDAPPGLQAAMFSPYQLETSEAARAQVRNADVIVIDVMIDELTDFLLKNIDTHKRPVYAVRGSRDDDALRARGIIFDDEIREFYRHLKPENVRNLVLAVARKEFDRFVLHEKVKPSPRLGLYHADSKDTFPDTHSYFDWYRRRPGFRAVGPVVCLMIYAPGPRPGQIEHIDMVIRRLEQSGFNVGCVFGWAPDVLARLMTDDTGNRWMDAILAFSLKFQSALDARVYAALRKLDVPIFNLLNAYYGTIDEWQADPRGLKPLEVGWAVSNPELSGLIEPSVVSGKVRKADRKGFGDVFMHRAIEENLDTLIPRIRQWIDLQRKPNEEKRVAILFYNNSPGKQNLGASYLNVFQSLSVILERMAREGYRVESDHDLTRESIRDLILAAGRNIGAWAPGELEEMLGNEAIVRVPMKTYKEWFMRLPESYRAGVIEQWGPPEKSDIMTHDGDIVVPGIRLGNVMLMPEPSRGYNDDPMKLYHSPTLYPHHQYTAAYLWMKYDFGADAQIHLGTHGTHEWLPGKQVGLSAECPPDVLITDIPSLYPYIVDDVGEGIQAKRRGRAAVIDHLIPAVKEGGLYKEYSELYGRIGRFYETQASGGSAGDIRRQSITDLIKELGIDKDISLTEIDEDGLRKVEAYLNEMRANFMPYGLHTFGVSPVDEALSETVLFITKMHPDRDRDDIANKMTASGPNEIDRLIHGLNGRYVPPGSGNDPFRNPKAIPTGKNFYGFDPERVPSKAAHELGRRAAEQMIHRSLKQRNRYPEKVAIVLWATETIRNEGVNEATMLQLLGMRPVWDKNDRVTGVVPIPGARLKRPRIDVTADASGLYRDLFPNMLEYLDSAVQKALVLTDVENLIRKNSHTMKARLMVSGLTEEDAELLSRMRIFSEKPGNYGNRVVEISSASGFWESDTEIADAFQTHTGYAYGQGRWGLRARDALRLNLKDVDTAAHSISSTVYGTMDNDDMFQYLGGLSLAIRKERGTAPDTVVTMQRRPNEVTVENLSKTIGRELRTRYLNPKWIDGMKKEDYAGAREMSNFVDYLWGWQVTTPFAVDEAKWSETYEVYVQDKYNMGLREFFSETNPWAYQSITARMLESVRKGYWKADERIRRKLSAEYALNVVKRGLACCDHTCNNPALNRMVAGIISIPGVMSPDMAERFRLAVEQSTKRTVEEQAASVSDMRKKVMEGFEKRTKPEQPSHEQPGTSEAQTKEVEGYKMEEVESEDAVTQLPSSGAQWYAFSFVLAVLGLAGLGLALRRRRDRKN